MGEPWRHVHCTSTPTAKEAPATVETIAEPAQEAIPTAAEIDFKTANDFDVTVGAHSADWNMVQMPPRRNSINSYHPMWSPEEHARDATDQSGLTRRQRERVRQGRYGRRSSRSASPRLNSWRDKGKGPDPGNWGNVEQHSELEPDVQEAYLNDIKNHTYYDTYFGRRELRNGYKPEGENHGNKDYEPENIRDNSRSRRNRSQRNKYKEKQRRAKNSVRITSEAIDVGNSASAVPKNNVTLRKRDKRRKSALKPTEQLENMSYINNAFRRAALLDNKKVKKSGKPNGDPDDSNSSSSSESDDPSSNGGDGSDEDEEGETSEDEQREKARYFWRGLRDETKERLRYDGISPESSSYERIIRKAEHAELAWRLTMTHRNALENAERHNRSGNDRRRPRNRGRNERPNQKSEGYVGRRTNGLPGGSNSNQTRARNHYEKGEKARKDYRNKPTYQGKAQLSAEEKSRRKADGLCYNCGKADHMARNCPKANSVNEKGFRSNRIDNYNVNLKFGNETEGLRALAETTESTHNIRANMIEWSADNFNGVFDDDLIQLEDVKSRPGWKKEVSSMFETFEEEEPVPSTSADTEFFTAPDADEWFNSGAQDWFEPRTQQEPVTTRLGDPILERVELCLARGAPYHQDKRRGALAKDRFYVHQAQGMYVIADSMMPHIEEVELAWEKARDPRFNVAGWYQKRLDEMYGVPKGRNRRPERRRPDEVGDFLAQEIKAQLDAGMSYPGESYAWMPREGRFKVRFNPNARDYLVEDTALRYTTRLTSKLLEDPQLNLQRWYTSRLIRGYEDLWDNIVNCWPEDRCAQQLALEPEMGYHEGNHTHLSIRPGNSMATS
ncbi:hypothetical protein D9611_013672 [Ephemerocybe angulata]|uniref:CCHC-type domain-containing protein n=1 Tax=Ephemerocybe angulata TaxID=980116 RepID=A0A8H5BB33_9AGAR|nr:hypothetical protein D9611_013672 [Tulosesus angulatus]